MKLAADLAWAFRRKRPEGCRLQLVRSYLHGALQKVGVQLENGDPDLHRMKTKSAHHACAFASVRNLERDVQKETVETAHLDFLCLSSWAWPQAPLCGRVKIFSPLYNPSEQHISKA